MKGRSHEGRSHEGRSQGLMKRGLMKGGPMGKGIGCTLHKRFTSCSFRVFFTLCSVSDKSQTRYGVR